MSRVREVHVEAVEGARSGAPSGEPEASREPGEPPTRAQ